MKGPHWGWYLLIAILTLAPATARILTWHWQRQAQLDPVKVAQGEVLFHHEWKPNDPLAAGGDGLGPVFNAASCVACHHQPGPGGAGGNEHNVTVWTRDKHMPSVSGRNEGVIHAFAVDCPPDTMRHVDLAAPAISRPPLAMLVSLKGMEHNRLRTSDGIHFSQRNTPALYGAALIDSIPDRFLIANERMEQVKWGLADSNSKDLPVGRAARLPNGRIGHFGWKGQSPSLAAFVQAACANELGLGNPGQAQPQPLGKPYYMAPGNDLTLEQCDQITSFVASLPRPLERLREDARIRDTVDRDASAGKHIFNHIGCAECHMPKVGSVEGIYSDLLLHDMGQPLEGGGSYNDPIPHKPSFSPSPSDDGPLASEWRTPPLWGVADSAPYLHDGRAPTLESAIEQHGGQAERSAKRFATLPKPEQSQVIAFLKTLRAPQ